MQVISYLFLLKSQQIVHIISIFYTKKIKKDLQFLVKSAIIVMYLKND